MCTRALITAYSYPSKQDRYFTQQSLKLHKTLRKVQDILSAPALVARDKGLNVAIGVKFGRWYKIAIKILKGENWLSSLMWTSTQGKLERNLGNKESFLYKDPNFGK